MAQQLFIMMSQYVLYHTQNVERGVGEVLEPMLAPVHWKQQKKKKKKDYSSIKDEFLQLSYHTVYILFGVCTDYGSHNFKADERIVLKELDKRKRQQREILCFSKDGWPVSQGRQDPAGVWEGGYNIY